MTSGVTGTPRSGRPPASGELAWHTLSADQVLRSEGVDGQRGLSSAEAAARAQRFGPNEFAAGQAESRWHAFFRQYRDPMQVVLLAAGIGSLYPLKQLGTGILLILLTLFNAVMGLHQEGKAAAAVAALQKMVIIKARVRRDGQLAEIPAGQLVPGDIVAIEAGDIVPADGRLLTAATLEVDESALTGESLPVAKGTEPVAGAGTPLGDRTEMVYMNTNVTRGAGEFVITATGMATEVGHISGAAAGRAGGQDPAHPPDRPADGADPGNRGHRAGRVDGAEPGPGRDVHRRLRRRRRLRHRRDPGRAAHGGHDHPGLGDAAARQGRRDHETAGLDPDARLHLGDQLGQDRHADAEPDDRGPDDGRRTPVRGRGDGLLDRRADQPGRRADRHPAG